LLDQGRSTAYYHSDKCWPCDRSQRAFFAKTLLLILL